MNKNYILYLKSEEWDIKRKNILKRDNYTCVECGSKENLNVHHLTYRHRYEERSYELVTLCKKCHEEVHFRKKKNIIAEEIEDFEIVGSIKIRKNIINIIKDNENRILKIKEKLLDEKYQSVEWLIRELDFLFGLIENPEDIRDIFFILVKWYDFCAGKGYTFEYAKKNSLYFPQKRIFNGFITKIGIFIDSEEAKENIEPLNNFQVLDKFVDLYNKKRKKVKNNT